MSDARIKKYRQQYVNLPPISSITEGYSVRYRIISEDRNRTSHWSPVYLLIPDYTYVSDQIKFFTDNSPSVKIASFTWDPVVILKNIKIYADITNKSLTSDLATLTTSDAHYMSVNDWVTVENVDSTFNGTYKINAVTNNTFSYYKDNGNIASTAVSPAGTRKTNTEVDIASQYDIWLRWDREDNGDWIYKERVSTTSVSYPHSEFYTIGGVVQALKPTKLSIEIYLPGSPIQRSDGAAGTPFLKVYRMLNQSI